ncbi:MAG TPA: hypothetical protein VLH38_03325 [Patescibacteria group bacterium]|nr:hypothetical protein [Patescibacteria group bacterium]
MTNQQILTQAIQKAIDGEWTRRGVTDEGKMHFGDKGVLVDWLRGGREYMSIGDLMLDHAFAKALWGEGKICIRCKGYETMPEKRPGDVEHKMFQHDYVYLPSWQYHLQQMVVAEDPIKYLGEHL